MRQLLLFLATSTILLNLPVISSERDFELFEEQGYQLTRMVYDNYYQTIPSNPNVYDTVSMYSDQDLIVKSGEITQNETFIIVNLTVNSNGQPVFELDNGNYMLATSRDIFDDLVLEHAYVDTTFWLGKDVIVQTSAIGNQAKEIKTALKPYQKVSATELVTTPRGSFAKLKEGWVSIDSLSKEDNRIEQVQSLLNEKYSDPNLAVYVYQIDTGLTAGVNQQKEMYAASIAKLPVLYYAQWQLTKGMMTLSDSFSYIAAVHDFKGAYLPEGSGLLPKEPDQKDYSLEELIHLIAKQSDNVASNILAYYVARQFDADYYKVLNTITQTNWDMETKIGTAEMAGQVMTALYELDPSGVVLESLSKTDFDDQRIAKNSTVKISHKIGDAYDFRHDVALVYTESPYVIAIFTENKTYEDITNIADDVYQLLK